MIVKFNNDYLKALFTGLQQSGKPQFSHAVIEKFKKTVLRMLQAENVAELKKINSLNFELLKGDRKGFYSVRVDFKYRLILTVEGPNVLVTEEITIEELTNHYQ